MAMNERQKMEQKIVIKDSQNVKIIQVGGNLYGTVLLPKDDEANLSDGAERNFCFISIDVVGHSKLSDKFNPGNINQTLMNLHKWLNSIILDKNGKELNWAGDGGIFYFLQEKASDRACDNAVLASIAILDGLADFNQSPHNQLYLSEERKCPICLRIGIDFGRTIYRANPGNCHSEALNTSAKIQNIALPNSALITHNVYKDLTDTVRTLLKDKFHLRESSVKFKDQSLYIFSKERIIDKGYKEYFTKISRLRMSEFEHLGYWVDLYAIETKLRSLQPQDRGKVVKAVDMINESVKEGKNGKIIFLFSKFMV